jgi:hypothetical protein
VRGGGSGGGQRGDGSGFLSWSNFSNFWVLGLGRTLHSCLQIDLHHLFTLYVSASFSVHFSSVWI